MVHVYLQEKMCIMFVIRWKDCSAACLKRACTIVPLLTALWVILPQEDQEQQLYMWPIRYCTLYNVSVHSWWLVSFIPSHLLKPSNSYVDFCSFILINIDVCSLTFIQHSSVHPTFLCPSIQHLSVHPTFVCPYP